MFGRRRVVGNPIVARRMHAFFELTDEHRGDPVTVAERYGRHLFAPTRHTLIDDKKLSRSRFYVGIAAGNGQRAFAQLTRRAMLISDTLLLSHNWEGSYHHLGIRYVLDPENTSYGSRSPGFGDWRTVAAGAAADSSARAEARQFNNTTQTFGMSCPDLEGLGAWILDAEPLLTAGLAWYLPSYSLSQYQVVNGERHDRPHEKTRQLKAVDVVMRNGRVVDGTGQPPLKSHLVREVLRAEVPFVDGVGLRDFGLITVEEFDAFASFRDFMRQSMLDLDPALDGVQSEHAIVKLGLQINDGLRSMRAEMEKARRRRAVAMTGAVVGSVSTTLVAVYGPALATAIAAIGASGGLWGVISAYAENSTRSLKENKWYYVWALSRKANS